LWDRIPPGAWISVLWVLCVVRQRSLRRAYHSSRGVLPNVVKNPRQWGGLGPIGLFRHRKKNTTQSMAMNVYVQVLINCIVMFVTFVGVWLHYHDPFTAQRKQATGEASALCTGLWRHELSIQLVQVLWPLYMICGFDRALD
jgi:hypothetical protein